MRQTIALRGAASAAVQIYGFFQYAVNRLNHRLLICANYLLSCGANISVMPSKTLVIAALIGAATAASAQSGDAVRIAGIVCNADSATALPSATVGCGGHRYVCDAAGRFVVEASAGDTLTVAHVGFAPAVLVVPPDAGADYAASVFMRADTTMLPEVIIRPRFERLAEMSRYMPAPADRNELIAAQNVSRSTRTALTAPSAAVWDASQNARMKQDQWRTDLEYRGMIPPDRMVAFGTAGVALIVSAIRSIGADRRTDAGTAPLSDSEVAYLIRLYDSQRTAAGGD